MPNNLSPVLEDYMNLANSCEILENEKLGLKVDGFDEEKIAQLKLNSSPIRKLSLFYAKARSGRLN